jgi:hypothetical protein
VDTRRTSSDPTGDRRCSLRAALLAACLLVGWSASGAAAPSVLHDDESNMAGPQLVTGDYTLEIADLMGGDEQSPEARDEPGKVPYLYLTPRVATILENVFGADAAEAAETADAPAIQDEEEASSTSPVAENVERSLAPQTPSFEHSGILPRFQRQMYRTDI